MLHDLPSISEIIASFDLAAKKSLGQNFILDLNITEKIARQGLPYRDDETLVEVGPGPGALTRGILLNGAQELIALEKDQRCLLALESLQVASKGRLRVQEADALQINFSEISLKPLKIIANLPYNISTQLLIKWIEGVAHISGLVLMFQKEVALRLVASPRSKAYGRLSILTQLRFQTHIAFDLPPSAFKPAPKVTSSIVVFKPRASHPTGDLWEAIKTVTQSAFAQRRKMLRKTLQSLFSEPEATLAALNLSPTARAEELSPDDFIALSQAYLQEAQ
ncbi:MAG TPA: 16S rRNA (adenine(1518)-N(6)/adenine(1519)-N(6))-dimethyltransferase [Holosporales bacterium]|nr:16S rRNA (adenine(1518)-N(6)/adenine(1519)-N(6))-dimethyltransferase [Holosporales bacterium]